MITYESAKQLADGLISTVNVDDVIRKIEGITTLEWLEMDAFATMNINMQLYTVSFIMKDYSIQDKFNERVRTSRINYKYKYINEGEMHYFKNVKEVEKYFGVNIHKIWSNFKRNIINGELHKINELHIYDSNNKLIKTIVGDSLYQSL